MNRQPTPANILDAVLTADEPAVDRLALRRRLRWDYNQVSPTDRKAVEDAAVDILANGQRLQQSAVAIGERLIGVKRFLPHGLFGDWCATEFHMSQKTAENMMNVAREFGDKIETVSILTDSAMYMLAAPSTPEPARQQAIEEAQQTGKSPTKSRVREIIAEHKPGPVPQPIPSPTAKEYGAAVQAAQPGFVPIKPADDRIDRANALVAAYQAVQDACQRAAEYELEYERLVGTPSDLLAVNRCIRQLPDALAEPIYKLRHLIQTLEDPTA